MSQETCEHKEFAASVKVERIEDIGRFAADITINCSECGEPFRFLGLPIGLNLNGATVSFDLVKEQYKIIHGVQGFNTRKEK
jgi:hypothetical protein